MAAPITALGLYICDILNCQVTFTRKKDCKRHKKQTHSDHKFFCNYEGCNYRGSKRGYRIKKYMKKVHGTVYNEIVCEAPADLDFKQVDNGFVEGRQALLESGIHATQDGFKIFQSQPRQHLTTSNHIATTPFEYLNKIRGNIAFPSNPGTSKQNFMPGIYTAVGEGANLGEEYWSGVDFPVIVEDYKRN